MGNIEKPLYHLNIKVIEAKDFPNNTGKTDPFIKLYYKDDLNQEKTKILDNILTPMVYYFKFFFN